MDDEYKSLFEIENISEMAFSRSKAMGDCLQMAPKFLEHFHKIYCNNKSPNVHHWCSEMQEWFNKVKSIKLSSTNHSISDTDFYAWFLSAGRSYEDYIKDASTTEIDTYEAFCQLLLSNRNDPIESIIRMVGIKC